MKKGFDNFQTSGESETTRLFEVAEGDKVMKKVLAVFLLLMMTLCLTACTYSPPEGWTKNHHTYEEILTFAETMDPNATVSEEYTDTVDENDWQYREWEAVINGVNCHVSSVSDWVWNDGFWAGEFTKVYYRIDTDYDYTVIQKILADNYPEWKCGGTVRNKYYNNTIFIHLMLPEFRMLVDDEIEQVWQSACEINEEYKELAIGRKIGFAIPSPGKYWNGNGEGEYLVKKDSQVYIDDFTEEGKKAFLQEYKENWELLESGLPVND